ncbi:hypothetical protein L7F22_059861 [Adiantum nelumboides]|nr:hypothetical protein [Adiantum nelumboides]
MCETYIWQIWRQKCVGHNVPKSLDQRSKVLRFSEGEALARDVEGNASSEGVEGDEGLQQESGGGGIPPPGSLRAEAVAQRTQQLEELGSSVTISIAIVEEGLIIIAEKETAAVPSGGEQHQAQPHPLAPIHRLHQLPQHLPAPYPALFSSHPHCYPPHSARVHHHHRPYYPQRHPF